MRTSKQPVQVLTVGALLSTLYACAAVRPPASYGLDPAHARLVEGTCHDVVGLTPGESHFDGCTLALAQALRSASSSRLEVAADSSEAPPFRSYFSMSPAERHERERIACARLGQEPASASDTACVASLETRLFALDHPLD